MSGTDSPVLTRAYVWWCQDEECDCYQPVVEERQLVRPGTRFPHSWVRVWEGTFRSAPNGPEYAELKAELAAECERRGIEELPE